jgi:FkbM family methyltransferase
MIKEAFVKHSPDWLFATTFNLLRSKRTGHKIYKRNDGWMITGDSMALYSPTSKYVSFGQTEFEQKCLRYFKIEEGDVCVDVGACIGDTTQPMATLTGKTGMVYAVEPDKLNLKYLKVNLSMFENVFIIPKGVWKEKGTVEFSMADAITGHSIMPHKDRAAGVKSFEVDTLDNMFKNIDIDFAKIDVQGAETEIFAGGFEFLRKVNKLVVESHYRHTAIMTYPSLMKLLSAYYPNVEYCSENGVCYAWR